MQNQFIKVKSSLMALSDYKTCFYENYVLIFIVFLGICFLIYSIF